MKLSLKLTYMSGMKDGESILLQPEEGSTEVTLGRSEDCTVAISHDPQLSRKHARLLWNKAAGSWMIEDLNSTNGTFVGEFGQSKRITEPTPLAYGDIFRIGHTSFRPEPPQNNDTELSAEAYAQINQ